MSKYTTQDYEQIPYQIAKLNRCLAEIEEICRNSYTTEQQYYYRTSDMILQKIKEVKGNE